MVLNRLELVVTDVWNRPDRFEDPSGPDGDPERDDEFPGGRELLIAVDGTLVLQEWGGLGMEPDVLLNPAMPLLPPLDGTPVDVVLQRCSCGIAGCGSVTATIPRDRDRVLWSHVRESEDDLGIGPFSFDAVDYEAEVRRQHGDRWWESMSERVARMLTDQLSSERDARPLAFAWAAGRPGDVVDVSYFDYRPNPDAGKSRRAGRSGFFVVEPDELFEQYVGRFPIDPNSTDTRLVDELLHKVRATHPSTWPAAPSDW